MVHPYHLASNDMDDPLLENMLCFSALSYVLFSDVLLTAWTWYQVFITISDFVPMLCCVELFQALN